MRYFVGCLLSAVFGVIVAVAAWEWRGAEISLAAEGPRPGPAFPEDSAPNRSGRGTAGHPPRLDGLAGPLGPEELSQDEQVNVAVYDNVNRSVVNITTRGVRGERFFLMEVPTEGAGSGSVLDKLGHILTNNHVIEGARQATVTLFDGKSYEARFVGADPINDVAVIKIEAPAESLHPGGCGDARELSVGMWS